MGNDCCFANRKAAAILQYVMKSIRDRADVRMMIGITMSHCHQDPMVRTFRVDIHVYIHVCFTTELLFLG